ncbi:hypothetical protein L9F63_018928, partial [Diploptera punctata]
PPLHYFGLCVKRIDGVNVVTVVICCNRYFAIYTVNLNKCRPWHLIVPRTCMAAFHLQACLLPPRLQRIGRGLALDPVGNLFLYAYIGYVGHLNTICTAVLL